mmetsp:Transcript_7060/g.14448  ORF Transcript_7060/g.14448 Transcript_7060/m.14448 type:complete len:101 (+) Transcript_7060:173-475(+)
MSYSRNEYMYKYMSCACGNWYDVCGVTAFRDADVTTKLRQHEQPTGPKACYQQFAYCKLAAASTIMKTKGFDPGDPIYMQDHRATAEPTGVLDVMARLSC